MAQEVTIVLRSDWKADFPKHKEYLEGEVQRVVIHHTATKSTFNLEDGSVLVKSIQSDHMTRRNFDDIGYNFLIGGDGSVFEGRGWGVVGAHAKSNNRDSLGVAFLGNFTKLTPSDAAISSARRLLQCGVSNNHISSNFTLLGHRDLSQTECPGDNLYSALPLIVTENK